MNVTCFNTRVMIAHVLLKQLVAGDIYSLNVIVVLEFSTRKFTISVQKEIFI